MLALATAGLAVPSAQAVASTCGAGTPLASDFDGDGKADLVVGTGTDDQVRPSDGGAPYTVSDTGGLESADLNGDKCADAILAPGQDSRRRDGGSTITFVPGTPDGLDTSAAATFPIPHGYPADGAAWHVTGFREVGIRHDGISQVAVAVNQARSIDGDDGGSVFRGFLDVYTVNPATLAVTGTQSFAFEGDELGDVGAGGRTIALGLPTYVDHGVGGAGAVLFYTPTSADPSQFELRRTITQDSPGVPGTSENGDHWGSYLAMRDDRVAVGAPEESKSQRVHDSGAVQPILWDETSGSYTAYRRIDQDTKGVPGTNERDDMFGSALAIARGLTGSGSYDILIGADEAEGSQDHAGSVTVANFSKAVYRRYTQASAGVPGAVEAGDAFSVPGVLRSASGADTVVIGAPGENDAAGYAIRSDGKKLSSSTKWTSIPDSAHLDGWGAHVMDSRGGYILVGE